MSLYDISIPDVKNEPWSHFYMNALDCANLNVDNVAIADLTVNNITAQSITSIDIDTTNIEFENGKADEINLVNLVVDPAPPVVGQVKIFERLLYPQMWLNPNVYSLSNSYIPIQNGARLYSNFYFNSNPNFTTFLAGVNWVSVVGPGGGMTSLLSNSTDYGLWGTLGTAVRLDASLNRPANLLITCCFDALSQAGPQFIRRFSIWIGNPVAILNSSIVIATIGTTSSSHCIQCMGVFPAAGDYFVQLRVENNDSNTTAIQITNMSYAITEL